MTHIKNHTQNLFAIDTTQDLFQELTSEQAAAIQGGAAIEFFEHAGFSGVTSGVVDYDLPYVGDFWNDKISSIRIYSGEWVLWSDANNSGSGIILGPGEHDLTTLNGGVYNDVVSSIRANVR
jgi:hypothetical protein